MRLGAHHVHRRPRGEDRPAEVNRQDQVELREPGPAAEFRGEDVGARIVDPGVDPAEHRPGPGGERVDLRFVGEVERKDFDATTQGPYGAAAVSPAPSRFFR